MPGQVYGRESVVEDVAAVDESMLEVAVCAQEGKKTDGLDGKAGEKNAHSLANLLMRQRTNASWRTGCLTNLSTSAGVGGEADAN